MEQCLSVSSTVAPSIISCVCKNSMPDTLMLICTYCNKQQHAACYRIIEEEMIPTTHCCVECSKDSKTKMVCTDSRLVKMSTKPAVVLTCIFRRALVALMHMEELGEEFFSVKFGIGEDLVQGILTKMLNEGIVHGRDRVYKVDHETLETVALPRYL